MSFAVSFIVPADTSWYSVPGVDYLGRQDKRIYFPAVRAFVPAAEEVLQIAALSRLAGELSWESVVSCVFRSEYKLGEVQGELGENVCDEEKLRETLCSNEEAREKMTEK